jgi:hypothetical protein
MNAELEKTVDSVLANGELTDRSRNLLMKKAEQLGVDLIDFELELENKIAQKKSTAPKSNKEGSLKKCPSCGASTKSFQNKCEECGHEFRNVEVNSSMNELLNKLKKISKSQFKDEDGDLEEDKYFEARAEVIRDFSIPTSKEDIIEFATKSIAEFDSKKIDNKELNSAWESKSVEAISKLQIFALADKSITPIYEKLEKKLNERIAENKKRSRNDGLLTVIMIPFSLFVSYLMFAFILSWFGKNYWPF